MRDILLAAPNPVERGQTQQFFRRWYIGELNHWQSFKRDAFHFYNSKEVQNGLADSSNVPQDYRKDSHSEASSKPAPVKFSSELDFYGYFHRQVFGPCETIARSILKPDGGIRGHILAFSSEDSGVNNLEPDTVTLDQFLYNMEVQKETRLAGYVDPLEARVSPIQQALNDASSKKVGSLRYMLGQSLCNLAAVTDTNDCTLQGQTAYFMLLKGLRYGFFSCYDETIFLRINLVSSNDRPEFNFPQISYSSVISADAQLGT